MRKLPSIILTLVLLALVIAAVSLDAGGPILFGLADYQQFLPIVNRSYQPPEACLPHFSEPLLLLELDRPAGLDMVGSGDFDGDGWEDLVVARLDFGTARTFEIDILLSDGSGHLREGTSQLFSGPVPRVQHPREIVIADFNGDGRDDIFIADHGQDAPPHPGYPNTLVLSTASGGLVDATGNLPQQSDFTHSATAADIDADGDVDLFVGNVWGQNEIPQQIWLNDGTGRFHVATGRMPPAQSDLSQGYTTCLFADVNNDGASDLILGGAGPFGADSVVLLNNARGYFALRAGAMPPKPWSPVDMALDIQVWDIDYDGYLDLFISYADENHDGRYIQVLINNGDGTFRDETPTRLPQVRNVDPWIRFIDLLDLDYDGDVDIVGQAMAGEGHPFYLNDGWGYFRRWDKPFEIHGHVFALLDLTGDGRRDIVRGWSAGDGEPEQYYLFRDMGCTAQ